MAGFVTIALAAVSVVVAVSAVVGLAVALLSSMIFAFLATDLCLLARFLSFDFGRCSLCIVAPCCLLAWRFVILRFVRWIGADAVAGGC